jgi:hypothetical protein
MLDIQKVKDDYENLKKQSHSRLLPFDKIIELEKAKEEIIEKYLSKITKIDGNFEIQTNDGFNIDNVIKFSKNMFGDLNFFDTSSDDGKIMIDMAFHFCIISLSYYNDKMKFKITVFWDL